jgi:hypothetical protein
MLGKIKRIVASKKFLYVIMALFALQGIYFAAAIKYKIPPDEKTHFLFTQYYSHQQILSGPFITHQQGQFVLGDIQRTTSYLYQYLLSFPLRVIQHFTSDIQMQVFVLRLISVLLGIWSLFILSKLFNRLRVGILMSNLILLAITLTGMYVWIFSAINYDDLAIPLFFLMLIKLLDFIRERSFTALMWSTFLAMALAITKFTYVPIVILALAAIPFWYRGSLKKLYSDIRGSVNFSRDKLLLIFLIFLNLLFIGLVAERYVYNFAKYHSVTPACTKVHALSECMQTPNFSRNYQQDAVFKQFKAQGNQLPFSPIEFSGQWIEQMYEKIFFYFGHKYMYPNSQAKDVAGVTFAVILIFFLFRPSKIIKSRGMRFIAYVTCAYTLILFIFNMHTYLSTGAEFGFQGRYMLPVLPFIYLFVLIAARNFYQNLDKNYRKPMLAVMTLLIAANIYAHTPLLVFMKGTDNVWYTQRTATFDNKLKAGLNKAQLLHGQVKYGQ